MGLGIVVSLVLSERNPYFFRALPPAIRQTSSSLFLFISYLGMQGLRFPCNVVNGLFPCRPICIYESLLFSFFLCDAHRPELRYPPMSAWDARMRSSVTSCFFFFFLFFFLLSPPAPHVCLLTEASQSSPLRINLFRARVGLCHAEQIKSPSLFHFFFFFSFSDSPHIFHEFPHNSPLQR